MQFLCPACDAEHRLPLRDLLGAVQVNCDRCGYSFETREYLVRQGPGAISAALKLQQRAWQVGLAVLLVLTAFNVASTFRDHAPPVPGGDIDSGGWFGIGAFRDLQQVRLVSRDLHLHPSRAGVLVLSVIFVNDADRPQPFPRLELTLLDAYSEPVARRVFGPAEYVALEDGDPDSMAPRVHVPARLEFIDPGMRATGFEIEFR